jgi:outer membrane biosynthesis protein TonB
VRHFAPLAKLMPGGHWPGPVAFDPRGWLAAAVLGLHLVVLQQLADSHQGWGLHDPTSARIEVAFVRELAPAAPAAAPTAPAQAMAPSKHLPAVARPSAHPASAPRKAGNVPPVEPIEPVAEPAPTPSVAASAPEPVAQPIPEPSPVPATAAAEPAASAAVAATEPAAPAPVALSTQAQASTSATAPPAPHFDWPPSTRLNYKLIGDYQGPVHGSARVDWLRQGSRYQVRLESWAGPLFSRQVVSDGELTDAGLLPRRFSGEQRVLIGRTRRWALQFGPERITLADGREVDRLPGSQDEASQFVHLTWLFTMQPDRLKVGQSIEFPLALNRKLERWTFDVVAQQALELPFGTVDTFHVKPRREASGGDMTAEMWFAPSLQYLPVRIMIRQRQEHWVDLQLEKPPLQAADAGPGRP